MPHERTRRPAHPSSPSFHTSPGRGAKRAFPTGPMGDRAHAMADRSSQDQRARTREDAQRMACARATLQVGRGGCNAPSMYCDTNFGKSVDRSNPISYIRCFLPQPFVPACPMPCPCLRKRSVAACLPYFLCLNRFELSDFCIRSARWACARASTLVGACALCDMQRRSARQLLGMWVHAYFFPATCNKHWVVISFGDICLSAYPCSCGFTLTNPPPHTLPYYPQTKHPSCPLSQFKTIGGGLPPSERGCKTYDWRAAAPMRQRRFCLSSCSSLPDHGLPRSHTWPHTLTTPLHTTTLHSHLLPAHIPAPHSHLYFGYKTACPAPAAGPRLSSR